MTDHVKKIRGLLFKWFGDKKPVSENFDPSIAEYQDFVGELLMKLFDVMNNEPKSIGRVHASLDAYSILDPFHIVIFTDCYAIKIGDVKFSVGPHRGIFLSIRGFLDGIHEAVKDRESLEGVGDRRALLFLVLGDHYKNGVLSPEIIPKYGVEDEGHYLKWNVDGVECYVLDHRSEFYCTVRSVHAEVKLKNRPIVEYRARKARDIAEHILGGAS